MTSQELRRNAKNLALLFAEDHQELRENISEILQMFFKKVDSVENGEEALERYKQEIERTNKYYDLVLSDIRMPKLDGVTLTREIYKINPKQKIIILSAHDESHYLLELINLGIEHFVKKPIDYQEFMKILLKVSKNIKPNIQDITLDTKKFIFEEDIYFDREKEMLFHNETNIYLTRYEMIFLKLLSQNKQKIFTNEEISTFYTEQNKHIDEKNIRKLVSKLRKKLPKNALESVYGVGYRLIPATTL